MIQFLVTAIFAVIALFLLALLLCLMIWVVAKLLRFLFPQKFSVPDPVPGQKDDGKKKKSKKKKGIEDRCETCQGLGACPVAFSGSVTYPCPRYVPKDSE